MARKSDMRMAPTAHTLVRWVFVFLCTLAFYSCGGGTTGTGGTGAIVQGRVTDPEGAPIEEVLVTLLETGDSATTDANGDYSVATTELPPEITLLLEQDALSAVALVEDIPTSTATLTVDVELDEETSTAEIKRKEVVEKTPTPRPRRTQRPTPAANPSPGAEPTVPAQGSPIPTPSDGTPAPDPTETATGTPTETEVPTETPTGIPSLTPTPFPGSGETLEVRGIIKFSKTNSFSSIRIILGGKYVGKTAIRAEGPFSLKGIARAPTTHPYGYFSVSTSSPRGAARGSSFAIPPGAKNAFVVLNVRSVVRGKLARFKVSQSITFSDAGPVATAVSTPTPDPMATP